MIKKNVILANLVALSLILFLLESMIPLPIFAPGAKLGLSQVVVLFTLYYFSAKDAFLLLVIKCSLSAMFFGGPTVFAYSLAGGILSLSVMTALKTSERFSILGVSAAGGFFHNFAQLTVAYLILNTKSFFYYISVLGPIGIATGIVIGFIAGEILKRIRLINTP